ncbi:MAG: hypothetical protein KKE71_02320, partial [Nanoarchaeota archaeon]|nr:hypothetical protein [Nanoarchaeota archaeon]
TSVNETKEYGSGPSTSSIETLSTRCATVKVTCNEILGNYASLKLREDDYTRQGMKADYDKLIRGYEDDLFPKCKEQLSGCN